nr:retrovirus-related Pol polyprotein from transposon TNT 1-94 [Tanacetum cinerariifolium]
MKGIKREFSVARTLQQNGVDERKNRALIEAARTMLADLKLLTTFWADAVNIGCYVQNKVLVIKPHNKTPYELFLGRKPALSFIRPFGCLVTILNTVDHLDYILLQIWTQDPQFSSSSKDSPDARFKPSGEEKKKDVEDPRNEDSEDNDIEENIVYGCADDQNIPYFKENGRFGDAEDDDSGVTRTIWIHTSKCTRKEICTEFEKMMHKKFHISSMRELTFFLGLQVKQKEDRIFISQDKYVKELLSKFGFSNVKTVSKPIETHKTLIEDEKGEDVDEHLYRSMIGSLMYP